ncbi:MAG: hypothetical protein KJN63_01745 [Acidimicrobiia bacterium]|nr:hypothetical protein [Acidimicrobiia bacterium]
MKLYERPRIDKELDRLPELPEGVEVPDDISGLVPPSTLKATGGGIRWMRWLAVILVLGAIGLAGVLVVQSYSTTEIDQARVDVTARRHLAQLEQMGADTQMGATARLHLEGLESLAALPTQAAAARQLDVTASRHLAQLEQMGAEQIAVDYMATYGTDNPVLVQTVPMFGPYEGPGSNSLALPRPEVAPTSEYMDLYGTDNPVFVQAEGFGVEYTDMYGTEGLVFVQPESFGVEYTDMYGTESLVFVQPDLAGAAFRAMEPSWQPNHGMLEQILDPIGAAFRAMEPSWQPNYELLDQIIVEHPYADFYG